MCQRIEKCHERFPESSLDNSIYHVADVLADPFSCQRQYLTEVLRYVVLNPVRAKMVERPEEYRWSSYGATAGLEAAPLWLDWAPPSLRSLPTMNWRRRTTASLSRANGAR